VRRHYRVTDAAIAAAAASSWASGLVEGLTIRLAGAERILRQSRQGPVRVRAKHDRSHRRQRRLEEPDRRGRLGTSCVFSR
jgi:hypothetical protein